MSTILRSGTVESDNLMTSDVVSRSEIGWDSSGPGVVVGNHLVGSPGSGNSGVIYQTSFVNLEEFKSGLVNGSTVSVAVGKVGDDWAMMGLRPDSPLEINAITSGDLS